MINTQVSAEWDLLDKLEFAAWKEENPSGGMSAFQEHLDRVNGKAPQQLTVEVLSRDETKRLRRLYGAKLSAPVK